MTKMIKMSLVAAVAVAGLTSSASAVSLEEAVKATNLTGYVRYRLINDLDSAVKDGDTTEEAKAILKFTTPVNDMVKSNIKISAEALTKKAETKAPMNITEANFVVNAAGATVIAGLQTSQSPFFANNGDTRSHGVTALVPAAGMTVAGAYYTTTTGTGFVSPAAFENVMALGLLGKAGVVDFKAWYASAQDTANIEPQVDSSVAAATVTTLRTVQFKDLSALSVAVGADLGVVKLDAMKTAVSNDITGDTGVTKIIASGKAGTLDVALGYAMSEKDGGTVALDQDSDAISNLAMNKLNMAATTDATAVYASVGTDLGSVNLTGSYLSGSSDAHADFNELNLIAKYKMSKNFYAQLLYSKGDAMGTDFAYTQIEIKYSF